MDSYSLSNYPYTGIREDLSPYVVGDLKEGFDIIRVNTKFEMSNQYTLEHIAKMLKSCNYEKAFIVYHRHIRIEQWGGQWAFILGGVEYLPSEKEEDLFAKALVENGSLKDAIIVPYSVTREIIPKITKEI